MSACIFCLEGDPLDAKNPLLHNVKCRCNFCFHPACYERYDRKTICPMCRATVGELYAPVEEYVETVVPSAPSAPTATPIYVQMYQEHIPTTTVVVQQQQSQLCLRRFACAMTAGCCISLVIIIVRFTAGG